MTIPVLTTRTVATVHPAIPHLPTHRIHQQRLLLSGLGLSSFISTRHHGSDPRLGHQSPWQERFKGLTLQPPRGLFSFPPLPKYTNACHQVCMKAQGQRENASEQQVQLVCAACLFFCCVSISVVLIALLPFISATPTLTHTGDPGEPDPSNADSLHNKTGTFLPVASNSILTFLTALQQLRDEVC